MIHGSLSFSAAYRRPMRRITARGLVRATPHALELEWHDHVLHTGMLQRSVCPVQSATLLFDALDEITLRRTLLGAYRLVLRARSLELFALLPFASGAFCTLRLARADALRARELAASAHEALAEASLRGLNAAAAADFDAKTR
jgi:hypothetical protein